MTRNKILLASASLIAAFAATHAARADDKTVTIIFVDHGQAADPFHNVIKRGANDAATQIEKLAGIPPTAATVAATS